MYNSELNKHIGSRLKQRRILSGLSQERLAEMLGLTFQQIQKYEKGINRISASRLFEISKILKINVAYFFEGYIVDNLKEEALFLGENSAVYDEDVFSKKETLELLRSYYLIDNLMLRKHLLDLIKALPSISDDELVDISL